MYTYTLGQALNRTLTNQENQRLNLITQIRFPCGAAYHEDPIERLNLLLPLRLLERLSLLLPLRLLGRLNLLLPLRLPPPHPPLPPHLLPLLPPHAYRVVLIR